MDPVTQAAASIGIERYIDKYGLPLVILGLLAYAAWRVAPWIGKRIDKMIDRSIRYLDETSKAFTELSSAVLLLRSSFDEFKSQTDQRFDHIEELISARRERGGR